MGLQGFPYAFFAIFIIDTNHTGSFSHNYASCWLFSLNIKQIKHKMFDHAFTDNGTALVGPILLATIR